MDFPTRPVIATLALMLGIGSIARAHAIHSTHTTIRVARDGFTFEVRAFADDISASVARASRRTPPADSSLVPGELLAYMSSHMPITGDAGAVHLIACGVRRERDAYILCFRAPPSASLRLTNQLLTETHPDQVNIVQCEGVKSRRTFLFTGGKPPTAVIVSRDCAR